MTTEKNDQSRSDSIDGIAYRIEVINGEAFMEPGHDRVLQSTTLAGFILYFSQRSCYRVPFVSAEATGDIPGPPDVAGTEPSPNSPQFTLNQDAKCGCGHPQHAHFGGGACMGEFRKRDPEFPVVECGCRGFNLVAIGTAQTVYGLDSGTPVDAASQVERSSDQVARVKALSFDT